MAKICKKSGCKVFVIESGLTIDDARAKLHKLDKAKYYIQYEDNDLKSRNKDDKGKPVHPKILAARKRKYSRKFSFSLSESYYEANIIWISYWFGAGCLRSIV